MSRLAVSKLRYFLRKPKPIFRENPTQSSCKEECENKLVFPEWCEYYPTLNRNPKPKPPSGIGLKSPRSSPTPTPSSEDNDDENDQPSTSSSRISTSPHSDSGIEPASIANQNPEPWYKKQKFIWALIAGSIGIVIGILIGGLGCCAVANSKKKYKETKKSRLASESSGNLGKEGSGQHDWVDGYSTTKRVSYHFEAKNCQNYYFFLFLNSRTIVWSNLDLIHQHIQRRLF